jgi:hypothetical protein
MTDAQVEAVMQKAMALYDTYVQLSQYASIVEATEEALTWVHDPKTPLSLVVRPS